MKIRYITYYILNLKILFFLKINLEMDLSTLKEVLDDLTEKKILVNHFEFNDMLKELDDLEYNNKCKKIIVKNVSNWISLNTNHTFPKKKKKWINFLQNQKKLCTVEFQIPINQIMNDINKCKYINPNFTNIYKKVINFLNNNENKINNLHNKINNLHNKININIENNLENNPDNNINNQQILSKIDKITKYKICLKPIDIYDYLTEMGLITIPNKKGEVNITFINKNSFNNKRLRYINENHLLETKKFKEIL